MSSTKMPADDISTMPDEFRAIYHALTHAAEARHQIERTRDALVLVDGWTSHLDSVLEHVRGFERALAARLDGVMG